MRVTRIVSLQVVILSHFLGMFPGPTTPVLAQDSGVEEQIGLSLFPLWDHRLVDNRDVRTFLFLYHAEGRPGDDYRSQLLIPFYYWMRQLETPDKKKANRLYLFPLLYFQISVDKKDSTILFPFWWSTQDHAQGTSASRILPPLFRLETAGENSGSSQTKVRLGIPYLLELFEINVSAEATRYTGLSFFNWTDVAESGLALFRKEELYGRKSSYLFPLYYYSRDSDGSRFFLGGPVYGFYKSEEVDRRWYTPLVWTGTGPGAYREFTIIPVYRRTVEEDRDTKRSNLLLYPIFRQERSVGQGPEGVDLRWSSRSVLPMIPPLPFFSLYSGSHDAVSQATSHYSLPLLSYYRSDPDRGMLLCPLYQSWWSPDKRRRLVFPVYWNFQSLSGENVTDGFTYVMPTYFGWGSPKDYFSFAFPLYWGGTKSVSGWNLLIPLFWSDYNSTTFSFYSLPFTYVDYPSQKVYSALGGGATYRKFSDLEGDPDGWAVDLLWWLWGTSSRPDHAEIRLLPLFWATRTGEDRRLLLAPLWYRHSNPEGTHDYFFPIYGRFESIDGRLRRDFYAFATYVRTVEKDLDGSTFRWRDDYLWSLISFQENPRMGYSHTRILPLGYWHTESVSQDRTILGPLYYSHRIREGDRTHGLKLFLGNLFYEKTLVEDRAGPIPQISPIPTEENPDPVPIKPLSRDRGVLWPISRWGWDQRGNSYEWALPFYYHSQQDTEEVRTFFPLAYLKKQSEPYRTNYFRYFYLFNWETFEGGGFRTTLGQVVFDWMEDPDRQERRLRFLYPFLAQVHTSPEGFDYWFTPLCQGKRKESGGTRESEIVLFPIFFKGATELERADGSYDTEAEHFYLFPLFGRNKKSLRTDLEFLIPIFHLRRSVNGFTFNFRPFFSLRNEPDEFAVRFWPLHSHEDGEGAGNWWVSKYLYLSKFATRQEGSKYRLDPFLIHVHSGLSEIQTGSLDAFTLINYRKTKVDEGTTTSFHVFPLAFGHSSPPEARGGLFPLYYERNFGASPIDLADLWRIPFIVNHLRTRDRRHWSLLWKLAEYTKYESRYESEVSEPEGDAGWEPDSHDFRILHRMVVYRKNPTQREYSIQPLFRYSHTEKKESSLSIFVVVYRQERKYDSGRDEWMPPTHRLFGLFHW